jgi:hypothetical protein
MQIYQLPLILLFLFAIPAGAQTTDKSKHTPDFCQTDRAGRFYNGGRTFCGPVAASNAILCLAKTDYPQLIDSNASEKDAQIEIIRTLGSSDYMRTEKGDGTGPQRFISGLTKYVNERGGEIVAIENRGWVPVSKKFNPTESRPTLEWLSEAVSNPRGMACVNIGWYTHDEVANTYRRHGGHWMTVVGVEGQDEFKPEETKLLLHDPAPRSGKGKVTHEARVEQLSAGKLVGTKRGLPNVADGLYVIREGIVAKKVVKGETTHPIIDGALVMVLR